MRDNSGISSRLGSAIQMLLEVRWETQGPFLVATVILEFLSIFKKSQASSPFEALNSACLSRCQRDVRLPVQMRRGPRALSRESPWDSDDSSSCEMKAKPAFKPLQGNPAFLQLRPSRCPFHLRQEIQGPSNMPIAEGSLLLRCLWKVGIRFLVETRESALISRRIGVYGTFFNFLCWNWCPYILESGISWNLWNCLREVKPLAV